MVVELTYAAGCAQRCWGNTLKYVSVWPVITLKALVNGQKVDGKWKGSLMHRVCLYRDICDSVTHSSSGVSAQSQVGRWQVKTENTFSSFILLQACLRLSDEDRNEKISNLFLYIERDKNNPLLVLSSQGWFWRFFTLLSFMQQICVLKIYFKVCITKLEFFFRHCGYIKAKQDPDEEKMQFQHGRGEHSQITYIRYGVVTSLQSTIYNQPFKNRWCGPSEKMSLTLLLFF